MCFKTTTVGLRPGNRLPPSPSSNSFQNHYGWIETLRCANLSGAELRFQNHYGWIETKRCMMALFLYLRFKTTTVGLRRKPQCGRLCGRGRFKTTTVGLRPAGSTTTTVVLSGFKTTTVGLRHATYYATPTSTKCFKTTTVGLRRAIPQRRRRVFLVFQNHYGWIETTTRKCSKTESNSVSKPLRLDWDIDIAKLWVRTRHVSKPLRLDWDKCGLVLPILTSMFQNHYGWIETWQSAWSPVVLWKVSKPLRLDWDLYALEFWR